MKKTHGSKRRNVTGKRIRHARLAAKPAVSQEDLSGRLAVLGVILDQGAISRVEREERYLWITSFWPLPGLSASSLRHWLIDLVKYRSSPLRCFKATAFRHAIMAQI